VGTPKQFREIRVRWLPIWLSTDYQSVALGLSLWQVRRGEHIPTAKNIPWSKAAADDGTFETDAELRDLYTAAGVDFGWFQARSAAPPSDLGSKGGRNT
jgi:hypothetical protein